ncbi:formyltetrahydrofolate deformylase [Aeromicrobium wangtongii]|uniref:Formyltetrahydrofolate deformylase n=1 Tax=Aeromicrobium wangtongii TaxID=2969247 RepID=A0ABY5M6U6_9ACTN|nr:formyltetrahydrofolate deformylase [Aeromicrobium wangtongii]MCD9199530.1 formyltetrahydrofolate deformylase [Aeromicrobium wangtongii]UUP13883.1 formyltetrahydrofolate deformylase [Aeromicrobium wangtongii]
MTDQTPTPSAVLTLSCPDRPGIVRAVADFFYVQDCDIVESHQFGDADTAQFHMRVLLRTGESTPGLATLRAQFDEVARAFAMTYELHDTAERPRLLIMVSKFDHCLYDLLYRWKSGQLKADIVGVVSNHRDLEPLAQWHDIPFHHVPVTPQTKPEAEAQVLRLVEELGVDLVVLARYMQILSEDMCQALDGRAINIHHSFLPSFKGANPYRQAHQRGVKLIGATAHYVTSDLDEGPIIEQAVHRVDHQAAVEDLVALGRDLESQTLARAVMWHVQRRVILNGARTIVFN